MSEFGAVSVVSGNTRGLTNTLAPHVEIVFDEHDLVAGCGIASPLTRMAVIILVLKSLVESRHAAQGLPTHV